MYTVKLEKECACFKRSNFQALQHFESEEEASKVAHEMAKEMTKAFCKQHGFGVIKEDKVFLILLMS